MQSTVIKFEYGFDFATLLPLRADHVMDLSDPSANTNVPLPVNDDPRWYNIIFQKMLLSKTLRKMAFLSEKTHRVQNMVRELSGLKHVLSKA